MLSNHLPAKGECAMFMKCRSVGALSCGVALRAAQARGPAARTGMCTACPRREDIVFTRTEEADGLSMNSAANTGILSLGGTSCLIGA